MAHALIRSCHGLDKGFFVYVRTGPATGFAFRISTVTRSVPKSLSQSVGGGAAFTIRLRFHPCPFGATPSGPSSMSQLTPRSAAIAFASLINVSRLEFIALASEFIDDSLDFGKRALKLERKGNC